MNNCRVTLRQGAAQTTLMFEAVQKDLRGEAARRSIQRICFTLPPYVDVEIGRSADRKLEYQQNLSQRGWEWSG